MLSKMRRGGGSPTEHHVKRLPRMRISDYTSDYFIFSTVSNQSRFSQCHKAGLEPNHLTDNRHPRTIDEEPATLVSFVARGKPNVTTNGPDAASASLMEEIAVM